jgi:hypothetical protein
MPAFALSPDGRRILVGYMGKPVVLRSGGAAFKPAPYVRLIELASGKEVHRFKCVSNPRGLTFSPDGRMAASGSWRDFVYLWQLPAGAPNVADKVD